MDAPQPKHQLAEVLIGSHEQCPLVVGSLEHLVVGDARRQLCDVESVMPLVAEPCDDGAIYTLVGNERHAALPGVG